MAGELSDLFTKALNQYLFTEFRVGLLELSVSHIQYVNAIIILVNALVDTIWLIKGILWIFELT